MNEPNVGDELILERRKGAPPGTEPEEEAKSPRARPKGLVTRLLLGLGVLALQAGLAYVVMLLVVLPAAEKRLAPAQGERPSARLKADEKKRAKTDEENSPSESPADLRIESVFALEDLVVNPAFSGGERYLVLSLVFISDTKETQKEIEQKLPIIQDNLNSLLSKKGVWWYSNSDNREALREEIRLAVNGLLRTGRVTRVLFTKYVIQ